MSAAVVVQGVPTAPPDRAIVIVVASPRRSVVTINVPSGARPHDDDDDDDYDKGLDKNSNADFTTSSSSDDDDDFAGIGASHDVAEDRRPPAPQPPSDRLPLDGLHSSPPNQKDCDVAVTRFGVLGVAVVALLFAATAAFVIADELGYLLAGTHIGFQAGIPASFAGAALIAAFIQERTEVVFDRRLRMVTVRTFRMLFFGRFCPREVQHPFMALKGAQPKTTIGPFLEMRILIDTAISDKYFADELAAAADLQPHPEINSGTTPQKKRDKKKKKKTKEKEEDDEDSLAHVPVAEVRNTNKVLRSWRSYIDWLRDDAF